MSLPADDLDLAGDAAPPLKSVIPESTESFHEAAPAVAVNGSHPPEGEEIEWHLLSAVLADPDGVAWARCADLPSTVFTVPDVQQVWAALRAGTKPDDLLEISRLSRVPVARLIAITPLDRMGVMLSMNLRVLQDRARRAEIRRLGASIAEDPDRAEALAPRLATLALNGHAVNGTTAYSVWQPAAFRAYQPPPNLNLLAGGYVRRRQLTTLIGPPGVGKSRLSLWLGVNHICGRPFLGLDTQNAPAKWLFFGNENDPTRQKTDLEWFYKNLLAKEQAAVDENLFLHVIDQPDDGIITLADPDANAKLHATLAQVKPDVIVFDPWGNMIEGNENDNEEVRKTLKLLLRAVAVNSPDAAIIVIHHARTGRATAAEAGNNFSGGSLGRGSKALVSSARCELALWPGHSEDTTRLVLTCEKVNNVRKFEPKGLVFENGIYTEDATFDLQAWRDDIEGVRGGKTLSISDVVEIVRGGVFRTADIATKAVAEFGVSKRTVAVRLGEACTKGYLMRTMPVGSYTLGTTKLPPPSAEDE